MRPLKFKLTGLDVIALSAIALIAFSWLLQACKKTDFADYSKPIDKTERFFYSRKPVDQRTSRIMDILKKQNIRRNFVNKLPNYSGIPMWDKIEFPKPSTFLARVGDSARDDFFFLPFTENDSNLSMIMTAHILNDTTYDLKWYTSPDLNASSIAGSRTSAYGEYLFLIFSYMEGAVFERKDFFNVPKHILADQKGDSLTDSTKILHMKNGGMTISDSSSGLVANMCFYIFSGTCTCGNGGICLDWWKPCPTMVCTQQICFEVPTESPCPLCGGGGGTGEDPPSDPPGDPGEGGGGGDSCTNCPPPGQCRVPFYIEEPCGPGGPMPEDPPTPYNPNEAAMITLDTSITNNFPCLKTMLTQIPNINRETQRIMKNIFNMNTKINLHFMIDWSYSPSDLTEAEATPGDGSWLNSSGLVDTIWNYRDTIKINPHYVQSAAKEYMAGIIFHEAIHSFVNWNFKRFGAGEVDSNYIKTRFPIFWNNLPSYESQHEQMAQNWVAAIKAVVKYFYTSTSASAGLKDSVANSIAWGGLENTVAWRQPGRDTCRINSDNQAARTYSSAQTYTSTTCGSITKSAITDLKLNSPCN